MMERNRGSETGRPLSNRNLLGRTSIHRTIHMETARDTTHGQYVARNIGKGSQDHHNNNRTIYLGSSGMTTGYGEDKL
eukprot:scaffold1601_cov59-Cylindrotheca_fusiformis.AAC.5